MFMLSEFLLPCSLVEVLHPLPAVIERFNGAFHVECLNVIAIAFEDEEQDHSSVNDATPLPRKQVCCLKRLVNTKTAVAFAALKECWLGA